MEGRDGPVGRHPEDRTDARRATVFRGAVEVPVRRADERSGRPSAFGIGAAQQLHERECAAWRDREYGAFSTIEVSRNRSTRWSRPFQVAIGRLDESGDRIGRVDEGVQGGYPAVRRHLEHGAEPARRAERVYPAGAGGAIEVAVRGLK